MRCAGTSARWPKAARKPPRPVPRAKPAPRAGGAPGGEAPRAGGPLDQYCTELVAHAKAGKIDPILGRDGEIRQMVDILTRRRQNNPILTGEAGVGKTAVVEGLALRIAAGRRAGGAEGREALLAGHGPAAGRRRREGRVRKSSQRCHRRGEVVADADRDVHRRGAYADRRRRRGRAERRGQPAEAGAGARRDALHRGHHLGRIQEVLREGRRADPPLPGGEGRGAVRAAGLPPCCAAWSATLEKHHGVRILDEAITQAVKLSARYIPARQLPDKGVSLLDTACARVGMSQASIPAPVEDRQRRLALIDTELGAIKREEATGTNHEARRVALEQEHAKVSAELEEVMNRWEEEKALVAKMRDLRHQIETAAVPMPGARRHAGRAGGHRGAEDGTRRDRGRAAQAAGRGAAGLPGGRWPGGRRRRRHLDRHPGRAGWSPTRSTPC